MRKVYELICCLGSIVQWWDDLPSRLRQDIEGSGAEPGSIVKARRLFEYYCPKKSEADATLTAAAQGHGEPSSDRKAELVQIFEKASKSPTNCINPPFDCVSLNLLPTTCAEIASMLGSSAPAPLGRADDWWRSPLRVNQTCRRISVKNEIASSYELRNDTPLFVETVDGPERLGAGWFIVTAAELVPTVPFSAVAASPPAQSGEGPPR